MGIQKPYLLGEAVGSGDIIRVHPENQTLVTEGIEQGVHVSCRANMLGVPDDVVQFTLKIVNDVLELFGQWAVDPQVDTNGFVDIALAANRRQSLFYVLRLVPSVERQDDRDSHCQPQGSYLI